ELLDGPHDLGLGTVSLLAVEEPSSEIHVRSSRAGEASLAVGEPPLDRVDGSRLDRHQRVGALLGLLQEGELVIGEVSLAHQVLEGYRPSVAARRLAPGHHEVPVDVAVIEGAPSLAVSNGEDSAEVVAVTPLASDGIEPRHARQIIGALAQLVGELVRVVALDL